MYTQQLLDEIAAGEGKPLSAIAKGIHPNRGGKPVTLSCILRWGQAGLKLPDGTKVFLEMVRLGGRWLTTPAALGRFITSQTPAPGADPSVCTPARRSAARKQRAARLAAAELERAGI
jgi:hypothetical protein